MVARVEGIILVTMLGLTWGLGVACMLKYIFAKPQVNVSMDVIHSIGRYGK